MTYTKDIKDRKYEVLGDGICLRCKEHEVDELMDCQHYINVYKDGQHVFSGDSLVWLLESNFNGQVKNALLNLDKHRVSKFNILYSDYTIEKDDK